MTKFARTIALLAAAADTQLAAAVRMDRDGNGLDWVADVVRNSEHFDSNYNKDEENLEEFLGHFDDFADFAQNWNIPMGENFDKIDPDSLLSEYLDEESFKLIENAVQEVRGDVFRRKRRRVE